MWRNLEDVTGAYSEHAKAERYTQRRAARGIQMYPRAAALYANWGTQLRIHPFQILRGG